MIEQPLDQRGALRFDVSLSNRIQFIGMSESEEVNIFLKKLMPSSYARTYSMQVRAFIGMSLL